MSAVHLAQISNGEAQLTYPLEVGGVDDYPVKVGSMLLTLVEPHTGFERAYNRWYERDHFYAGCMVGPWLFAGSRWVATRSLKKQRWPSESIIAKPLDAGSYVAIYWVEKGHHADHFDVWAVPQVVDLYANGRGFPERTHVHTSMFDHLASVYRDEDPVPVDLALDHKYDGLFVLWWDAAQGTASDLHAELAESYLPGLLAGSDIEIASSWAPTVPDEPPATFPWTSDRHRAAPIAWCSSSSSEATPRQRWRRSWTTPPPWSRREWPSSCWRLRSSRPSSAQTPTSTSSRRHTSMLRDEKILITGPAGQIAFPIAESLGQDNEVWGIARFSDEKSRERVEAVGVTTRRCDIGTGDFSALPTDFTYLLHLAAYQGSESDYDYAITVNAEGAGFLMQHCRKAKAALVMSTSSVYRPDESPMHAFLETDPVGGGTSPWAPTYAVSKIAEEAVVRQNARSLGLPTVIARMNASYGPNGGLPANNLDALLAGNPIVARSDPCPYSPIFRTTSTNRSNRSLLRPVCRRPS